MAYIGRPPANAALTSADITDGIITNADIAANAAIEQTKLATLTITDSNITDGTIADTKIAPPSYAAVANFPAASSHTGRIVHAVSEDAMYFSDGTTWVQLAENASLGSYQPLDAGLTDIAALAVSDGNIIVGNGSNWVAESGATARTSLGLANFADLTADQTFTAANRGTITAVTPAASVTFDLTTTNNFSLTLISTSADPTLNFPTLTSAMVGQSGNIYLDNVSGGTPKTISKAANILMTTASFNALSTTAGKYWLSYYVVDTTNVLVTASAVLA